MSNFVSTFAHNFKRWLVLPTHVPICGCGPSGKMLVAIRTLEYWASFVAARSSLALAAKSFGLSISARSGGAFGAALHQSQTGSTFWLLVKRCESATMCVVFNCVALSSILMAKMLHFGACSKLQVSVVRHEANGSFKPTAIPLRGLPAAELRR